MECDPPPAFVLPKGIIPVGRSFDTSGPMAKDARDLADLLTILVDSEITAVPAGGYASLVDASWNGIKVGTLNPRNWQYPEVLLGSNKEAMDQIIQVTDEAWAKIGTLAESCHKNIELRLADDFLVNGAHSIYKVIDHEYKQDIDDYLSDLQDTPVKSLQELVDWNLQHSEDALPSDHPGQEQLVTSINSDLSADDEKFFRSHYTDVGNSLDEMFKKYDIDIVLAPGDCFLTQYASAKGYPIIALPLTTLDFNGRPIGIQAISSAHNEAHLIKFMSAYESSFPPRPVPLAYKDGSKSTKNLASKV